jgi:anti-anti-sigma factor
MNVDSANNRDASDERLSVDADEISVPGAVVFRLQGRLDVFTYNDLKESMDPFLAGAAGKCWLVDLSRVPFVASSGWSVFIATRARLNAIGAKLGLLGLLPEQVRVYQSMRMGDLVPAFANLAEATHQMGLTA